MTDLHQCRIEPVHNERQWRAIKVLRKTRPFVFVADPRQTLPPPQQRPDPVSIYQVAFGEQVDRRVVENVRRLFKNVANSEQRDRPGYIYCFHDIGDPPTVLKVGRTSRKPEERLAEWENDLAPEPGRSIILLFAYPTSCNKLAERVVHELLRCRRIHNRFNPVTGDELIEFFTIDNALALSIFIRLTLGYIDSVCRLK